MNTRMSVYVDDELAELLAEIYVLYPFAEENECEWYMCVMFVSVYEGRRVRIVYVFYICIHLCEKRG